MEEKGTKNLTMKQIEIVKQCLENHFSQAHPPLELSGYHAPDGHPHGIFSGFVGGHDFVLRLDEIPTKLLLQMLDDMGALYPQQTVSDSADVVLAPAPWISTFDRLPPACVSVLAVADIEGAPLTFLAQWVPAAAAVISDPSGDDSEQRVQGLNLSPGWYEYHAIEGELRRVFDPVVVWQALPRFMSTGGGGMMTGAVHSRGTKTYLLRDLPPDFWLEVKSKAKKRGIRVRTMILEALAECLVEDSVYATKKRNKMK